VTATLLSIKNTQHWRITLSRQRAAKAQKRITQVENTIDFSQAQQYHRPKAITLVPRTRNQERLVYRSHLDDETGSQREKETCPPWRNKKGSGDSRGNA
jgi:hypothetical protein